MSVDSPKVTVLMSVYNGEKYLQEAIESILTQTFRDFEFIIINDGSTDNTGEILKSYTDERMISVDEGHQGLIVSLNQGLSIARGEYIARLDSDDVALPDRLEKQVAFLCGHPEIGILGTACWLIDANGQTLGPKRWPINDLQIRWESLLGSPFGHPTVIIRRDVLIKNRLKYDEDFQMAEDYDLWTHVLNYTCGENLSKPLIRYRVHDNSVTSKYRELQLKNHDRIALRQIREQLPDFVVTLGQVSQLRGLFVGGGEFIPDLDIQRVALAETYLDMLEAFMHRYTDHSGLKQVQRQQVERVALIALHPPIRRGWPRIFWRLITMEPGLPVYILGHFFKASRRWLRQRISQRFSAV